MALYKAKYTKEQDELILSFGGHAKELAASFGVSVKAIHARRSKLKYSKLAKSIVYKPPIKKEEKPILAFARPDWFNEDVVAMAMRRN